MPADILQPFSALVFDLDGTLLDTSGDLARAANRVRESFGIQPLPVSEVMGMVGNGMIKLIERTLGSLSEPELKRAVTAFRRHYGDNLVNSTSWYPGLEALLQSWVSRVPIAILTNKPSEFTRGISLTFGLRRYASIILCPDHTGVRKPEPDGLLTIAHQWNMHPSDMVLIGDHHADAGAADAAGCQTVGVSWGYGQSHAFKGRPLAKTAHELSAILEQAYDT